MLRAVVFPAQPVKCPLCDGVFLLDLSGHPRIRMRKTGSMPKGQKTMQDDPPERDEGQTRNDGG